MKEKLAKVQARMTEITAAVEKLLAGDGSLTAENQAKVDELQKEFDGLRKTADALKAQIDRESYLASIPDGQRPGSGAGLNEREEREIANFSFLRVINSQLAGSGSLDGLEAEMMQEGRKEVAASGLMSQGFHVPAMVLQAIAAGNARRFRADVTAGGSGTGADVLTREPLQGIVDPFYARMAVRQLGATYLSGLQGNVPFPKMGRDSTKPAYRTEVAAAQEITPTTSVVTLSPKRLPAFVEVSRQFLLQTSPSVEAWIRNNLLLEIAEVWEKSILHTASNGPTALAATAGIGSVAGGTNGAAPTYDHIVDLETAIANADADIGSLAYLTNSAVRGKLKKTSIEASTNAEKVWDRRTPEAPLNGYRAGVSNCVSRTLTKGSATAVASAIFFGNWSDLIVAQWGGLDLLVNPFSRDTEAIIRINAWAFGDSAAIRPESFAAMLDALTA